MTSAARTTCQRCRVRYSNGAALCITCKRDDRREDLRPRQTEWTQPPTLPDRCVGCYPTDGPCRNSYATPCRTTGTLAGTTTALLPPPPPAAGMVSLFDDGCPW